jgi:lipopolysaccharide export LptBFGC system permease protein LptF
MLHNKIYQNFLVEIIKNFFLLLFIFSLIALTVRAVNFLDLIVDSGYPISTYFAYSLLNLFGLVPKFIPISFLITLMMFILKHNEGEFVILWTSGVDKIKIINIMLLSSILILIFYIIFSSVLSPSALNKSRQLLGNDKFNSFLPTVRSKQFGDTFIGLTFIVDKKKDTEIENVFLHDTANNLKGLSSDSSNTSSTTVIAKKGVVDKRKLSLIDGQIISSKRNSEDNELISFDLLNIDLKNFVTSTIKKPKIQETSTIKILDCLLSKEINDEFCNNNSKKEITPNLIRRLILPLYIPTIVLICSFLILKNRKIYLNKFFIFLYSLSILVFSELFLRFTGLSPMIKFIYIFFPIIIFSILYLILFYILLHRASLNE